MNAGTHPQPPAPHRVLLASYRLCVIVGAASLLLSWWAVHLDPVINTGGVWDLHAARLFADSRWSAGQDAATSPLYALLIGLSSRVTGVSPGYVAHVLGAGFHLLLVMGFVALAGVLGGSRRVTGLAALVVLLFPALNSLRPDISADAAYWAMYLWSLAWFVHHATTAQYRSLLVWALLSLALLMFGLQAVVFLITAPLWLWAARSGPSLRAAKTVVALLVGLGVGLCYLLWQQQLQDGAAVGGLTREPLDYLAAGWQETGRALRFKLESLRSGFLDPLSRGYGDAALLATLVLILAAGLVRTLGALYTGLLVYTLATAKRRPVTPLPGGWGVYAVISTALLLVPAAAVFTVTTQAAMTAVLTLLAVVPLGLDRLRQVRPLSRGVWRWAFPLVMALLLATGLAGLDLRSDRNYLREAGLWLDANAGQSGDLYSNSPVVVYYSGLDGYRKANRYTWRDAMNRVHRGEWRDFDYLALVIERANRHRGAILMRSLDMEPVKIIENAAGDRVLIFRTPN